MQKQFIFLSTSLLFMFSVAVGQTGTTNSDAKAKQLEEMRKLKNQMMDEQKTIQQQQEWNAQTNQNEIKKLNQENQQKTIEIQVSKQEAT